MTLGLDDHPIALPHLEERGGDWLFLGERLPPPQAGWPALLVHCDGSRSRGGVGRPPRQVLQAAHRSGFVLPVRPVPTSETIDGLVVVSPHPDDAVLSLGAHLAGRDAVVIDVFSVERWTQRPYYAARPELTERLLVEEEQVACRLLGIRPTFLGYRDAPQRPPWTEGFLVDEGRAHEVVRSEAALLTDLGARLRPLLAGAGEVYVPLGSGGHVDHVLCREAVLQIVDDGTIDPRRLRFFEDVPASLFRPPDVAVLQVAARLGATSGARPMLLPSSEEAVCAKAEALRAYRLQCRRGLVERVIARDRARSVWGSGGAERVWWFPVREGDTG